jgi:hypothetical protein
MYVHVTYIGGGGGGIRITHLQILPIFLPWRIKDKTSFQIIRTHTRGFLHR